MNELQPISTAEPIPAFAGGNLPNDRRAAFTAAFDAWLFRTPSPETRRAYPWLRLRWVEACAKRHAARDENC